MSYFVLYVRLPCLVGLAAEINKTVKTVSDSICTICVTLLNANIFYRISFVDL